MTISTTETDAPTEAQPRRAHPLPMALTIARIIAGPVLAALVLWAASTLYADPLLAGFIYGLAALVFIIAALTDWADGYLARKLGAVSPLGAALDHCADKVLVTCVLVALAYAALPLDLVAAAAIILGRDVAVAGLREGLSASGRTLPVSQLGKWKAAAEMAGIAAFLLQQASALLNAAAWASALGWCARTMLWAGAALALISGARYVAAAVGKPR